MRARIIAVVVSLLLASADALADPRVHVVAAGESLELLARRYGTSVDALRELNALEGDRILVGQELTIEPTDALRYTTVPGDTLLCIGIRYGVDVDVIREDNPELGSRLEVGRTLVLRGAHDPRSDRIVVREGDTLASIAERLGLRAEAILQANEDIDPEHLAVGAELALPSAPAITHRVRDGDTLTRIARRYDVSVDSLRALNPDVEPLRSGVELVVREGRPSRSVGAPTCGWIAGDVQIPADHPAFVLRDPERAWATQRTVRRLISAFDAIARTDAPRVRVHDASLHGGGPIDDHRSHQSGRDVDITYYQREGCGREGCPLREIDPEDLDVRRQWTLLRHWLRRDDAEAIFIDYALQAPLYREARRRGATAEELERWFQYPRGRTERDAVIRHFPNHRHHLHVRFACGEDEPRCH